MALVLPGCAGTTSSHQGVTLVEASAASGPSASQPTGQAAPDPTPMNDTDDDQGGSQLAALPTERGTVLVRTDFSQPQRWNALLEALETPSEEGFLPSFIPVEDRRWQDATAEDITAAAPDYALIIVADAAALSSPELAALVIYISDGVAHQLRAVPASMWSIENNLSLANMDWESFADAAGTDGVYRGLG
ncbi:DUF6924 domain-containing protein [Kineococcus aurantiacus]|uniref:DUF6924 domain-containing protein n=1 Tax=Kineococcus aurantiacus TaxID=37633 RepID=A0A7Y9J349_9ACTN|nr:hypothetical protein [Kineococcus aurantiacus]NYD24967.1 hypothetical protein [Kineococcus aurantiacus]